MRGRDELSTCVLRANGKIAYTFASRLQEYQIGEELDAWRLDACFLVHISVR